MKLTKIIAGLLLAITVLIPTCSLTGCRILDPAGVYGTDQVLFNADTTIATSYDLLHSYVKWEFENRAALAGYPEVKQSADHIRANARPWIASALALRDAYAANPTGDNRDRLLQTLAVIRAALTEATKYMAQYQPQL